VKFLCCAQAFHTLYHTDESVLLGAPTGSGKTISAELAMLRVFRAHPGMKVIYIAPLKVCRWAFSARPLCCSHLKPCDDTEHIMIDGFSADRFY